MQLKKKVKSEICMKAHFRPIITKSNIAVNKNYDKVIIIAYFELVMSLTFHVKLYEALN